MTAMNGGAAWRTIKTAPFWWDERGARWDDHSYGAALDHWPRPTHWMPRPVRPKGQSEMTTMNDGAVLRVSGLGEAQQACVDLLKETLSEACAGSISSIAIVVCMKDGYATVMAGTQAADLNLGADSLKKKILDAVEGGNRAASKRPGLLRAR